MKRSQFKRAAHCLIPTLSHSGKSKTIETIKKISGCLGSERRKQSAQLRVPSAYWNYSAWYYNGGYMSSRVHAQLPGCEWLFATPQTVAHQAPLSMGFPRQEYWNRGSYPPPGDLSDPGTEPTFPVSPALAGAFFTTVPPGKLGGFPNI